MNNIIYWILAASILFIGITFFLCYQLFKKTIARYFFLTQQAVNKGNNQIILNAYERLVLLCERIQPDKLAIRLQSPQLNVQTLSQAMIVAIHQEFDHNVTQQIYISENLWNIICISKDEAIFEIIQTAGELDPNAESQLLTQQLLEKKQESRLNQALLAIRKEANHYVKK